MLERLARFCFRRRGRVLFFWIVALVVLQGAAGAIGPDWRADQSLPDSESQEVQDLLEASNPAQAGFTGQIVFEADQGVDDPEVQAAMEALFAEVEELDAGVEVKSPYTTEGAEQISQTAPIAFAEVNVSDRNYEEMVALGNDIKDLEDDIDVEGLRIEFGGEMFAEFELPASEALGILAAIIILIVAFGSVVAMGLPIGTALFGLGCGVALTMLLSRVQSMPDFAPQLTAMIGLGVGIDYALFIVTRYREGLHAGLEPEDATAAAVDTSGRAVLFAGVTVIISLLGLYIMGLAFVRGLATGAAAGVLFMMIAAVTLLPALIGFAGRKVEVTKWRGGLAMLSITVGALIALLFGAPVFLLAGLLGLALVIIGSYTFAPKLREEVPHRKPKPREQQVWFRWSRFVQHHSWLSFFAGLIVLIVLALPVFGLRMGFGDTGNYNEEQTVRQAYDMIAEGFGPGYNGPIIVTVSGADASNPDVLAAFGEALAANGRRRHGFTRHPDHRRPLAVLALRRQRATRPGDDGTRAPPARRRHPRVGRRRHGRRVQCGVGRLRGVPRRPAALAHRRGPAAQLPAADGRVPLAARAAEGRGHEPALDRRGVRRRGRGVPVGLGRRPHRRRHAKARSRRGSR